MPRLVAMLILTCAFIGVGGRPAYAQGDNAISVYVGAAGEKDGFTAVGASDSVADLTKALSKKKRLTVTPDRSQADVVVLVESRESHWETVGSVSSWTDKKGETHVYTSPKNTRVVHAALVVGEYRLPLHGENMTWSGASDVVARDVDKWVDQNMSKLIARRSER